MGTNCRQKGATVMAFSSKPSWQRGTPAELLGNANGPSGSGTVWRRLVLALGWAMNAGYLSDSDESAISTTEDPAEPQRNTRRGTNFHSDNGGWMRVVSTDAINQPRSEKALFSLGRGEAVRQHIGDLNECL